MPKCIVAEFEKKMVLQLAGWWISFYVIIFYQTSLFWSIILMDQSNLFW